ncbi:MAG: alpha/beta hydrolase [Actinomycetota bacterium]
MDAIRFPTDDGLSLEAELRLPEAAARGGAVLCHAHPRRGGSKDHPILWAVRGDLSSRGLAVLAFNFRGTMGSDGTHAGGRAEPRDVAAAITRVREESEGPTIVVGWSFGASVALREAIDDDRVAALALIGLPVRPGLEAPPVPAPAELRLLRRPVLLLSGANDEHSGADALEEIAGHLRAAEVAIVAGTDHHLWRREREAAAAIGDFVERVLG